MSRDYKNEILLLVVASGEMALVDYPSQGFVRELLKESIDLTTPRGSDEVRAARVISYQDQLTGTHGTQSVLMPGAFKTMIPNSQSSIIYCWYCHCSAAKEQLNQIICSFWRRYCIEDWREPGSSVAYG